MSISVLRSLGLGHGTPNGGGRGKSLRRSTAPERDPQPCLLGVGPETRIATEFGMVPARLLRPRDELRRVDGGSVMLRAVRRLMFDSVILAEMPDLQPILVSANAFGAGLPRETALFAPHQPIGGDADRHGEGFAMAEDCLGRPGVTRAGAVETGYFVLEIAQPSVLTAEGLRILV